MEPTPTPNTPTPTPTIPTDLRGQADLALRLKDAWPATPELVFLWTTAAEYGPKAVAFEAAVTARETAGQLRPQVTGDLRALDAKMEDGLNYVKGYLAEKFTKARAKEHYAQFGIVTYRDSYILPADQGERLKALDKLLDALAATGLGARDYGTAFWQPLRDQYATATGQATQAAQGVTKAIADREPLHAYVLEVLQAMLSLLDAQYRDPKARAAKRRELGYLDEFN
ncbi:hypothetical protein [Hymenobacter ruricola]|uniref:Uncharacterized protein n=1 Tax=Hymenobacter ruricola TaxID=2791023 RepID=A0ABS0I834_9BACT|nr:hypothetical protein [Hymenobacter ruricola]MBF9223126.1 hypothetical protein [Hymenobacter ruricola]